MIAARVAYAALVGWWAALLLGAVAMVLAGTIVGMGLALRLLERLPQVGWLAPGCDDEPADELRWDWRC